MILLIILKFVSLSWLMLAVDCFSHVPHTCLRSICTRAKTSLHSTNEVLEILREPLTAYANIWVPLFKEVSIPPLLLHWGHGSAMATVLVAMAGAGSYLGWQIRLGNGEEKFAIALGKTAREEHPKMMGLAALFFLLGGQGGLVLLAAQGQDILHSEHAVTALLGLGCLAVQV